MQCSARDVNPSAEELDFTARDEKSSPEDRKLCTKDECSTDAQNVYKVMP